jgi:hypothetical protein
MRLSYTESVIITFLIKYLLRSLLYKATQIIIYNLQLQLQLLLLYELIFNVIISSYDK